MNPKGPKNDRFAGKAPAKLQPKKPPHKPDYYDKAQVKTPKPTGAIPELDVFDYSNGRIDARQFNQARLKLVLTSHSKH